MDRDTMVYGVIGKPVYHSKGPVLHNKGFEELNLNKVYVPLLVDDFNKFMNVFNRPDFHGFRYLFHPPIIYSLEFYGPYVSWYFPILKPLACASL